MKLRRFQKAPTTFRFLVLRENCSPINSHPRREWLNHDAFVPSVGGSSLVLLTHTSVFVILPTPPSLRVTFLLPNMIP